MQRIWYKVSAVLALNVAVLGISGSIMAADAPCKGLNQTECQANAACSWVKPHKIASGKEVAAFCRKKPEKKAKGAASGTPAPAMPAPAPAAPAAPAPKG